MSLRTLASLAVAIVLGLLAIIIVNAYLASHRPPPAPVVAGPAAPGVSVVVAALPIGKGVTVDATHLKVITYPAGAVAPAGSFQSISQLTGGKDAQRVALHDLAPDEPILFSANGPSDVTPPGGKTDLASAITPGMQAIAFGSVEVSEVAGFVLPGDHVDVLLTRLAPTGDLKDAAAAAANTPAGNDPEREYYRLLLLREAGRDGKNGGPPSIARNQVKPVTQIILQNRRVLGVNQASDGGPGAPIPAHVVTIEVTPAEAQLITVAQTVGSVSLTLRHSADVGIVKKAGTSASALGLGYRASPTVKITRGLDTTITPVGGVE